MPAMLPHETALGLTSVQLSLGGAVISILSFLVALRLAWLSKFSPPKILGLFPYVVLYGFSKQDSRASQFLLVPSLWLTNSGARPMLVAEMRLLISLSGMETLTLYPRHTVPLEAIDAPNTFDEYDLLHLGKAPFSGFAIAPGERWINNLAFPLSPDERIVLVQEATVSVEIRPIGSRRFKQVLRQQVGFSHSDFSWLSWAGGPSADYFHAKTKQKAKYSGF